MPETIYYVADTVLENKSAYSQHVIKMCDAFGLVGKNVKLIVPYKSSKINYRTLKKSFLLRSKKPFDIKIVLNRKINNFFDRIFFGNYVAKYLKNKKSTLILTRSFYSSFFLSLFKIPHYLEIHSEIKSLTKFFMINLNFFNSKYVIKKILISKALNKIFSFKENEIIILHDGVDIKNFKKIKKIKHPKIASYVGSFYKGRGIEIILELAKKFPKLKFNLYGKKNSKLITNLKNVKVFNFTPYSKVPKILQNSDILLMPYANKVEVNAKNINTSDYCSPLKMFDYLASGKIILSSKRDGICEILKHQKNSIIINKYNIKEWSKEINNVLKKKYDLFSIQKKAIKTAKNYTWLNRANIILKSLTLNS